MSLVLAIETSSHYYSAALIEDGAVAALRRADPSCRNVIDVAGACLAESGVAVEAIDAVAVDIGPGNLSSVRAGLAFACGFAFGLRLNVAAVSSLELLGREAHRRTDLPALCARKGSRGRFFQALVDRDGIRRQQLGMIADVAPKMVEGVDVFAIAGLAKDELLARFAGRARDSGLEVPDASWFALVPDLRARGVDAELKPLVPISDFDEGAGA